MLVLYLGCLVDWVILGLEGFGSIGGWCVVYEFVFFIVVFGVLWVIYLFNWWLLLNGKVIFVFYLDDKKFLLKLF